MIDKNSYEPCNDGENPDKNNNLMMTILVVPVPFNRAFIPYEILLVLKNLL
jgi:hypothetical protein